MIKRTYPLFGAPFGGVGAVVVCDPLAIIATTGGVQVQVRLGLSGTT
jgi:hypothetical protein